MFGKFKTKQVNPWYGWSSTEAPDYQPYFNGKRLARAEDLELINTKLNLILDHLNLKYVPETKKKEPAKLVQKKDLYTELNKEWHEAACALMGGNYGEEKPKKKTTKKRGRPKGSKNKKK